MEKAELNNGEDKGMLSLLKADLSRSWKIEDSEALYRIEGWGEPYFSINAAGHITVSQGDRGGSLDLFELVNALKQRNLGLPLLIRFSDILEDRIERLNACFAKAIARYNYRRLPWRFPVKCNQRHLVEDLVWQTSSVWAGSWFEARIDDCFGYVRYTQALLICNGYKDREYIKRRC